MFKIKLQQGTSLYLSLMIMTILLSIALGLSTIFIGQSKMIKALGNSVIAFYAADAGIEEVLVDRANPSSICTELSPCPLGEAEYYLDIKEDTDIDCDAANFCIKSIGIFQETRRAIEIVY